MLNESEEDSAEVDGAEINTGWTRVYGIRSGFA
jgi:hypothetical protein